MRHRTKLSGVATAAALCVVVAIPGTALANPAKDVRKHVRNADDALTRAETLVDRNKDAKAAVQMARANVQAGKAHAKAGRANASRKEMQLTRRAAAQYGENAETFAAEIGELRPGVQVRVAEEIENAVDGRDHAVSTLTDLLDQVPAQAVKGITRAIGAAGSGDEIDELSAALESGEIAGKATDAVEQATATAIQSVQQAYATLQSLVDQLPAEAQPHVQAALDRVQGQLETVVGILEGVFGNVPSLPVPGPSGHSG